MEVIPAIDLRGGKCVRFYQGDYAQETVYSESPVEVARHWAGLGATRIHVVDLDGAREGAPVNVGVVEDIVSSVSVPIQLGGGIRTIETARRVLSLGVDRVMVGTAAVQSPELIKSMCKELGSEAMAVNVDVKEGYVAVEGWTQGTQVLAADLIRRMAEVGVLRFMYTDVARDGTLTEPNYLGIETVMSHGGSRMLVAGGISSVEHLLRLARLGPEGAVVGRALYTGDIEFSEALQAVQALN